MRLLVRFRRLVGRNPHVEIRNAQGERIDIAGNLVARKSPKNHTPIEYDLSE